MTPKFITVHCSATRPKTNFPLESLRRLHVDQNGWSDIGYHYYITTDGFIHDCRPIGRNGAHVKGHNDDNIGICLEGGLNNNTGEPDDTFNSHQKASLSCLIDNLADEFGIKEDDILGHRDWYGDANGDGVVDSRDWLKECPCFNVKLWLSER